MSPVTYSYNSGQQNRLIATKIQGIFCQVSASQSSQATPGGYRTEEPATTQHISQAWDAVNHLLDLVGYCRLLVGKKVRMHRTAPQKDMNPRLQVLD